MNNKIRCQNCKFWISDSGSIFDKRGCVMYPTDLLYPYSINIYCRYSKEINKNDTNTTTI